MNEALALAQQKAVDVVPEKVDSPSTTISPEPVHSIVLFVGVPPDDHKMQQSFPDAVFEDSPRRILAFMKRNPNALVVVVARNMGDIGICQEIVTHVDSFKAGTFKGDFLIATNNDKLRRRYTGKGKAVALTKVGQAIAKTLYPK